jgi:hypothetical protein
MKISSKPNPNQTVTKLDAARRQLDSAISLYFQESDPVAIHTLACAAHQIIHDINKNKEKTDLLYEKFRLKGFKKEDINRHYNFFKHADNDPDPNGEIEFNPKFTEIFMILAIKGLTELGVPHSYKMTAFSLFIQISNPRISTLNKFIYDSIQVDAFKNIRWVKRSEFFDIFLRIWR